ncbi:hypothetical protein MY1_0555 [Nitrosarchaeum koreense MY1]|uniref:Uncharacterized protein n=1 Tax=Nitrosarchaeum koreense MY1 TaxID=1001994 RepID=F9CVL8_9ARCH|nr:hypothetical protein MY1_0555 [Nitrosarchaeum koreense MY1]
MDLSFKKIFLLFSLFSGHNSGPCVANTPKSIKKLLLSDI